MTMHCLWQYDSDVVTVKSCEYWGIFLFLNFLNLELFTSLFFLMDYIKQSYESWYPPILRIKSIWKHIHKLEILFTLGQSTCNLDNRLNFEAHANEQSNIINKRLYSIRRMFFLPFELKMTFFNAFILPYSDYCISLSIFLIHNALKKLYNTYYLCLHKLFGFKFSNINLAQVNSFLKNLIFFLINIETLWEFYFSFVQ